MKSLQTLIKLQKSLVDEQQIQLSKLQARLSDIENQIAELQMVMAREQVLVQAHPESKLTYGAFVKASIKRERELEKQRRIAADAVEIARNKLGDLFAEQKRYEIAEEARIAEELKEENRLETLEMDEIGGINYTRKRK